jgi:hypothetical protein
MVPFAIRHLGAIWPKPPCYKPYFGPSIFSWAPSTLVGLTVYSPRRVLDLPGGRALRHPCGGPQRKLSHASLSACRRIGSPYPSASIGVSHSW